MRSVYRQLCGQTPHLPRSVERTFVNLPATTAIAIAMNGFYGTV